MTVKTLIWMRNLASVGELVIQLLHELLIPLNIVIVRKER